MSVEEKIDANIAATPIIKFTQQHKQLVENVISEASKFTELVTGTVINFGTIVGLMSEELSILRAMQEHYVKLETHEIDTIILPRYAAFQTRMAERMNEAAGAATHTDK